MQDINPEPSGPTAFFGVRRLSLVPSILLGESMAIQRFKVIRVVRFAVVVLSVIRILVFLASSTDVHRQAALAGRPSRCSPPRGHLELFAQIGTSPGRQSSRHAIVNPEMRLWRHPATCAEMNWGAEPRRQILRLQISSVGCVHKQ